MSIVRRIDSDTKDWILDAADEKAARAGAVMDLEAAAHSIDWVQGNCCLYEGEQAGELIRLMPYQVDFLTRLFGWRMYSRDWKGWVRRFVDAALWCPKKNGKSPFLAAIGLYLTIADGEEGQKTYMSAKNGDQARIAQLHAYHMVKASPALREECKTYENTLAVHHLPTNSRQVVLTGDDTRGMQAKEGLNGQVLIDETHVVDREMMERVKRAGISRRQRLRLSMSTAGDDPSSWGFERVRYGRQVAEGERDDLRFLHVEYTVPANVTEADVAADPARHGRQANPAWGHIVKADEFREDFMSCQGNAREVARFLQYRLDIWVGSTNRWLDIGGWAKGRRAYTLADMAGADCFAGLDLARRLDMAAFVFLFPYPEGGDECVRLWPLFWLPQDTADAQDKLFPFRSWAKAGHLALTPGSTIDYGIVKRDIRRAVRKHRLNVVATYFDQKYAEEITQQLVEGETNPETGETVAEGIGGERVAFEQTITALTGPSVEFERRVKKGVVQHPGNPVLTWQIGHAEVKTDVNQNIRPVKPDPHSGKKIDGVLGSIMALYGLMDLEQSLPRVQ